VGGHKDVLEKIDEEVCQANEDATRRRAQAGALKQGNVLFADNQVLNYAELKNKMRGAQRSVDPARRAQAQSQQGSRSRCGQSRKNDQASPGAVGHMDTARDLSSQRPTSIGGRRGSNRTAANQGEAAPARAASDLQLAWRRASVPTTGDGSSVFS